jgi:Do/DeqQ family serine protease
MARAHRRWLRRLVVLGAAGSALVGGCRSNDAPKQPPVVSPSPPKPLDDEGGLVDSPAVPSADDGKAERALLEKMIRGGQLGSRAFAALFQVVSPSVVNIFTTRVVKRVSDEGAGDDSLSRYEQFFGYVARERLARSLGSGFVIDRKGFVLTNYHVIEAADEIRVRTHTGREVDAKLVGSDRRTDLAVLKVRPGRDLRPLVFGDSTKLSIGDFVAAIGNPFGLSHTMTVGVVSAKGRRSTTGEALYDLVQTDATINPGNSGGPLLNLTGEVVGVNVSISALGKGIGFAIPIHIVREIIPQLITKGRVIRPWLGIYSQPLSLELARSFGMKQARGALVSSVIDGSPAERAGFRVGDILVAWNGKRVRDHEELRFIVHRAGVGRTVKVTVLRELRRVELALPLQSEPEDTPSREATQPEAPRPQRTLGLTIADTTNEETGGRVVFVQSVVRGLVAYDAGMRTDDVVLTINGVPVTGAEDFDREYAKLAQGDVCRLMIRRRGIDQFVAFVVVPP